MARARVERLPPGGRVLKSVREQIARGWPAGLTLLTGTDLFHLDWAQRELLEHLAPAANGEFGRSVVGDERIAVEDVLAAACAVPMFAPRRVVLVRDVMALEGNPDAVTRYASHPPKGSFLIVRALSLDMRRKLHHALATSGQLLQFGPPTGQGSADVLLGETLELACDRELELDRKAAAFLLDACAGDLYRVVSELEKVRSWLGVDGVRRVDLSTLQETMTGSREVSTWEMADAVERRERGKAVEAARRLLDSGEEPLKILGGLAWRMRRMLEAAGGAGVWGRPSGGPPRYSKGELLAFPARLLAADRTLKSRSVDARAVMESLMRDLTARGVDESAR